MGAEVDAGKDVVIGSSKGHAFCPAEALLLFLIDLLVDLTEVLELGEGIAVEQDQ